MKQRRNVLGAILLVIGALLLMDAFNVFDIDIIFDIHGWWTLFLIIPAVVSMSRTGVTAGNVTLLILGVGFLLKEQGWNLTGYIVPAIFIGLGFVILFKK